MKLVPLTKSRALECNQFGRTCDLISQWCDKKKSEVAPVRPAVDLSLEKACRFCLQAEEGLNLMIAV